MADAASSAAAAPRLRRAATAASHGAASSSSSSGAGAPSARRSRSSSQHRSGRHGHHHHHHHHHGHGHHQQQQLEQQRRRHQQELQRYLHYHPYAHLYAEPEPRPRDPFHVRESERLQSDAVGALSAGEWGELLGADEGADLARLREAARHGVPSAVRGDAWLLLLGVWGSDRSDDVARGKEMREEFAALAAAAEAAVRGVPSVARAVDTAVLRRVRHAIDEYVEAREGDALFARFEAAEAARRGEAAAVAAARGGHSLHHLQHHVQRHHHHHQRRHHHRHGRAGGDAGGGGAGSKASSSGDLAMWAEQPHDGRRRYEASSFAARAEAVLVAYLAGENAAFRPEMVSLAAPFVVVHRSVVDAFNAFRQAMQYVTYHAGGRREGEHLARLVALFRRYLPRLCECFEDEEVTPNDWALPWIRTLLASSLPLECVVRLWDTYFSADEGLDLHVFVCVAVLRRFNEELEEFEHSELRGFLDHLPVAGMDQVIQRALNMHGEARGDS